MDLRWHAPDIVVTPARAREIVAGIVERLPVTHLCWWAIPPGLPAPETCESLELFRKGMIRGS